MIKVKNKEGKIKREKRDFCDIKNKVLYEKKIYTLSKKCHKSPLFPL